MLWKEQVLRDLQAGNLTFNSIEITRDGKKARARFRLVAVYVESGRALRLVYFQSVLLPRRATTLTSPRNYPGRGSQREPKNPKGDVVRTANFRGDVCGALALVSI